MATTNDTSSAKRSARDALMDAAVAVIRQKGFCATSVDDLCKHAGVTKAAFIHHSESKQALGEAAAIREACRASIFGHAETLEADISEAMAQHDVADGWSAKSLALHTQAVIQGAFILAKADGGAAVAAESLDHLKRYVGLLFGK